jgi:2-(1,2-epoxy-1,2-dihydrophenyl)acetyl-CoA isomerase
MATAARTGDRGPGAEAAGPSLVELGIEGAAATITLNRPEALNAWSLPLGAEFLEVVKRVGSDPQVRAVMITGAGRAFCSGADLKGERPMTDGGKPDVISGLRQFYNPTIAEIRRMPKPVVAAVNGAAAGVGCSLALACDLVVAAESAYLLLAFANIGLTIDGGASATLVARAGHTRATEMAMLGEKVPAEKALEWGLVNTVVPDGELLSEAEALLQRLAAGPTGSYAATKRLLNERLFQGFEEQLDLEAQLQQERAESADFVEGVIAFLQKRPADFSGE